MRKSIIAVLMLTAVTQGLGPMACSNSSSPGAAAGGGVDGAGGAGVGGVVNGVGGSTAASTAPGICTSSCLKDCASDKDCNLSGGEMCCDYGPDGKACVPAKQCPVYCSDDSKCNVTGGEACMMTVEASSQLVCTQPANALHTCSSNTDCSTNQTCCTIYKTPVCLATNLCPAACSTSGDCNSAANEICCTSLPVVDKTLAASGLCVNTSKVVCPKLCGTSTECNTSAGEICCDGRCSTTCTKTCTSNSDCSGQICCKTKALNSPFRTTQTLGYAASTGGSGSGGTAASGGTRATGGSLATGGSRPTGGASPTGGSRASGGTVSTGGSRATGGTLATGGSRATGGASITGGAPPTGGATAIGGKMVMGGSQASGGASATGGTLSSGGATSSGGTTASTVTPSGGAGTGGTPATGGATGYCANLTPPTTSGNLNITAGFVSVGTLQGQAFTTIVNGSNTTTCMTPKCDNLGNCDPPWGGTALCAAGVVTADATNVASAMFGFNLNQTGSAAGSISAPPNITVSVVKGTNTGDSAARIVLTDAGSQRYCVDGGQWSSGSAIPIGKFTTTCWDQVQPGTALSAGANIVSITIEILSDTSTDRRFDICLTDVKIN